MQTLFTLTNLHAHGSFRFRLNSQNDKTPDRCMCRILTRKNEFSPAVVNGEFMLISFPNK